MNQIKPKISIITFVNVTKSNGRYELLKEALESISIQNYASYEHIIVDDGSTLSITGLVNKFKNTRYVRKEPTGILTSTYTFNMGHIMAEGEYCIYLASDDVQLPYALQNLANALDKHPNWLAVCGAATYEYPDQCVRWQPNFHDLKNRLITEGNLVSGCAVMWRRSIFIDKNMMPPNIAGFCSDYDLWLRIVELGEIGTIDSEVVRYRLTPDSTRHKTKNKHFFSTKSFDLGRFQFSKNSRLRYVKSSALRRGHHLSQKLHTPHLLVQDEATFGLDANNILSSYADKTGINTIQINYPFNRLFFDNKAAFDTADIMGRKIDTNETLRKNVPLLHETLLQSDQKVIISVIGISAALVWVTWTNSLNKHVSLIIDRYMPNLYFYDYINWANVDEIVSPDEATSSKLCQYLGLEGTVKISTFSTRQN